MKSESAKILCNPDNHNPLELVSRETSNDVADTFLVDSATGKRFYFKDNIPLFIDDLEIEGRNEDDPSGKAWNENRARR